MPEWIGREVERLRKLRGMRREDLAAQLSPPVSASTIRNIEHDERYNVSLELLRQIAEALDADLKVVLDRRDLAGQPVHDAAEGRRVMGNDQFIRLIRERYPECSLTNSQIGRRMWAFASARGATLVRERKQLKAAVGWLGGKRAPTTAAEYEVWEHDVPAMEMFADRLGRAFKDEKGRLLVPFS